MLRRQSAIPRVLAVAASLAVALVGVGVALDHAASGDARPAAHSRTMPSAPSLRTATAAAVASTSIIPKYAVDATTAATQAAPPSPPVHLDIPSIGVSSSLQALGLLRDGSLEPPTRWQQAGWYADGVVPGQTGPALIAGHIDSTTGPAIFWRLIDLKVGATVRVTQRSGHVLTFVVDSRQRYVKAKFPTSAVYGPTPDAELRLVTCTGQFDAAAHSYLDNLVVSAHLV